MDRPCLIETRGTLIKDGYRRIERSVDGHRVIKMAHRLAWEEANGRELLPWPHETVDHVCHNEDITCPGGSDCLHRQCVEPSHLAVATAVENWRGGRRGAPARRAALTECPAGHPYDEANTLVTKQGWRACRACHRDRQSARNRRLRGE